MEDHRGDEKYATWELHSKDVLRRADNYELANTDSVQNFISGLNSNPEYTVVMISLTNCQSAERVSCFSEYKMLQSDTDEIQNGSYYLLSNGGIVDKNEEVVWEYQKRFSKDNLLEVSRIFLEGDTDTKFTSSLRWNGKEYINDETGCYFLVYDEFVKELVCVRQLKVDESGKCVLVSK